MTSLPPEIEVIHADIQRGKIRHALFDFDGTLSLIREGWPDVMVPMMVDILMQTPKHESREELQRLVRDYVDRLTGKQTIYQMIQLQDEVRARGGEPLEALEYKHQYNDLLWERIKHRVAGLKAGTIDRLEMMVPGSLDLLTALRERGVKCYLASGTDERFVFDETDALGLTPYFDGGVYGALENWKSFSKAMLIDKILSEHSLHGHELVVFGDGFVEIENGVAVGGITVGVATDEAAHQGVNQWKRTRLIGAGADIIIPDYRQADPLVRYLFAK